MTTRGRPWAIRVSPRGRDGFAATERCLALAEALRTAGTGVRFYLDDDVASFAAVHKQGFATVAEPDPTTSETMLGAIRAGEVGGAVFDTPAMVDPTLAEAAGRVPVAAIETRGRPVAAHLVIDPRPGAAALPVDRQSGGQQILGGAAYALLAPVFAATHDAARERTPPEPHADRLLVAMGTTSGAAAASFVLDALSAVKGRGVVVVLTGGRLPGIEGLTRRAAELGSALMVADCDDPIGYYRAADLLIGHGGAQLVGVLCCGIPSISLARDGGEVSCIEAAAAAGATIDGGTVERTSLVALAETIDAVIADPRRRQDLGERALALVDGRGATRVARALVQLDRDAHG